MVFKRSGGFGGDRGKPRFEKKFGGKSFGKKPFGGRPGFAPRGDGELFPATCSSCGKPFELPFRPSGDRPVYCRECFAGKPEGGARGDGRREFRPGNERYAPPGGRYEGGNAQGSDPRIERMARDIESIVKKLDSISAILSERKRTESTESLHDVIEKASSPIDPKAKKKTVAKKPSAPPKKQASSKKK